jgi:hypothetical protein
MNRGVEVREELATADHVVGHAAIEVPTIKLVLVGADVEEGMSSQLLNVEAGIGLGAED